ncbi:MULTISPECIES: hypothetical protein [unclassified Phenylobacterium]|uniref:hypothetical protein n=1 Tax=unclassified Phenylobacterium TaxID=2640670 RepID=UPI000839FDFE|nr:MULTISPECIES: hypothetical protein [unclassified Phenylobacterium]
MTKISHAMVIAAAGLAAPAIGVAQPVGLGPPPFVYYIVPCGTPGAIAAAPVLPPSADAAQPVEAVCVVPVAAGTRPPRHRRYSSYAYDAWGPNYYSRPFYGAFGLSIFSGVHDAGGHSGRSHSGLGHGGGGYLGGAHRESGRSH